VFTLYKTLQQPQITSRVFASLSKQRSASLELFLLRSCLSQARFPFFRPNLQPDGISDLPRPTAKFSGLCEAAPAAGARGSSALLQARREDAEPGVGGWGDQWGGKGDAEGAEGTRFGVRGGDRRGQPPPQAGEGSWGGLLGGLLQRDQADALPPPHPSPQPAVRWPCPDLKAVGIAHHL